MYVMSMSFLYNSRPPIFLQNGAHVLFSNTLWHKHTYITHIDTWEGSANWFRILATAVSLEKVLGNSLTNVYHCGSCWEREEDLSIFHWEIVNLRNMKEIMMWTLRCSAGEEGWRRAPAAHFCLWRLRLFLSLVGALGTTCPECEC